MTDNAELMTLQKLWTILKLIAPTIFEKLLRKKNYVINMLDDQ